MQNTSTKTHFRILSLALFSITFAFTSCSDSGGGGTPAISDRVIDADFAYSQWPNESTSDATSNLITSKVLITDLDADGSSENIFISVLPNSSNKKSSVLRVTRGEGFAEVVNYKSNQVNLLQDAIPFPFDFNKDGFKELVFVSYDRDQVYAFEFKNKLTKMFVRWTAQLPETLPLDFDRRLSPVAFGDELLVKVGPFGLRESKNRKVAVVDLRTADPEDLQDDDDDD